MISPARRTAFAVLQRVEQGGYASDLLLERTADLDGRDAGLAQEIVFGVLRRRAQLDYLIEVAAGRPAAKLDTAVRTSLRLGVYQLRHLDRVPAHAVVSESVELVKAARKRSAAGLVNAVLRSIRRIPRQEVSWPSREMEFSMPEWLLMEWERQFGSEATRRIARAFLHPAETYVRNPPQRPGLVVEPTDVPGAYRVVSGNTHGLRFQDVGSQSIVPLLDLKPGQRFLDLCAAPGNKTGQALEYGVRGVACDVHLHRVKTVEGCPRVVLDATNSLPFRTQFDRILVDAPCSGTGTLSRNPEIRWRIKSSDLLELHDKQVAILKQGLRQLAPRGRLVYSTCSLEQVENEAVIDKAVTGPFKVVEIRRRTPGTDAGDGFFAALIVPV